MTTRKLGPFELYERIGVGGMGYVFRAKYLETGKIVALKLLPPGMTWNEKASKRFERELAILKRLKHPNIVRCYGGGVKSNQRFYAMELVTGGSLSRMVKQRGKLNWEEVVDFGTQICGALAHAHENGIIHRDLKPQNLLLSEDGKIKLADFGIALDVEATALTAEGKTVGTFTYMAPEQISGKSPVSPKTDLYALGCVLFKMITGEPPFESESSADLLHKHLYSKPPRASSLNPECPYWLDQLINQLLEKNPFQRPADAPAVARALAEVKDKVNSQTSVTDHATQRGPSSFHDDSTTAVATQIVARPKKKKKSKNEEPFYERAWFLALCFVVVLAALVWGFWPKSDAALLAKAEELMATEDRGEMLRARDDYLKPLIERQPAEAIATRAQELFEIVEMTETERKFLSNVKLGRAANSEAERAYAVGYQFEQFGDRFAALEQYQSLATLFKDVDKERPWVNLARRNAAKLKASGAENDRLKFLEGKLAEADTLAANGNAMQARVIWESIVTLYADKAEFNVQVERARTGIASVNGGTPDSSGTTGPSIQEGAPGAASNPAAGGSSGDLAPAAQDGTAGAP